jgi:hypothetical protein
MELYIYEVRDEFEQTLSYWDKEDDALLASEFEDCKTEVIIRRLNPFEVVSPVIFKQHIESLEEKGVPKSVIAEALGISRPTLNAWIAREPKLKPSQMIALNYLVQAFA